MSDVELNITNHVEEVSSIPVPHEDVTASEPEAPKALSIEDKARSMGWKPLEEFKGDPDVWCEPKEFVNRGSFFRKIEDLKEQIKRQEQVLKSVSQTLTAAEQRAYDKAVADVKAQMQEARLSGDFDAYEQAVQQQARLAQQSAPVQEHGQVGVDPRQAPEWKEFEVQNTWVNSSDADSRIKQAAAMVMIKDFRDANPGCAFKDVTTYVHKTIREKFPNDFKAPHTPNVSGVSRGSSGSEYDPSSKYTGLTAAQKEVIQYYEENKLDSKSLIAQFRKGNK